MHLNDVNSWMKKNKNYEYFVDKNGLLCFEDPAASIPLKNPEHPFGEKGYICFSIETRLLKKSPQDRYEIACRLKDEFFRYSGCKGYQGETRMAVLCDVFRIKAPREKKIKSLYDRDARFFDEDNHQIIIYPADSRKLKRGIVPGFLPI